MPVARANQTFQRFANLREGFIPSFARTSYSLEEAERWRDKLLSAASKVPLRPDEA